MDAIPADDRRDGSVTVPQNPESFPHTWSGTIRRERPTAAAFGTDVVAVEALQRNPAVALGLFGERLPRGGHVTIRDERDRMAPVPAATAFGAHVLAVLGLDLHRTPFVATKNKRPSLTLGTRRPPTERRAVVKNGRRSSVAAWRTGVSFPGETARQPRAALECGS